MRLERLKITGFKTFVDTVDFQIEDGLTGIVGPNGCGKSNLVEALRWVMGETSFKTLRGSGMDDVIFSGTNMRPARDIAEVMLRIDNSSHTAPAAFNTAETLEISRRINRAAGSTYKINGREVRARDVQILFADAASGARSPALIRQGQIAEIIAAKPQARRRILEDAAGVGGLHARRHEAEIRLNAAANNMHEAESVLTHITGQIDSLRKQGKSAQRYRVLSEEIRSFEQRLLHHADEKARAELKAARAELDQLVRNVAETLIAQGESERLRAIAAEDIEPLRAKEVEHVTSMQRLTSKSENLARDEQQITQAQNDAERRLEELKRDSERAIKAHHDARIQLSKLQDEQDFLDQEAGAKDPAHQAKLNEAASLALRAAETDVTQLEALFAEAQSALARRQSEYLATEKALRDVEQNQARLAHETLTRRNELTKLQAEEGSSNAIAELASKRDASRAELISLEAKAQAVEQELQQARAAEGRERPALADAERALQRIETEAQTIQKMLDSGGAQRWKKAVEDCRVTAGYEVAFAAALGEDIEASLTPEAPIHWASTPLGALAASADDPELPENIPSLLKFVNAPPVLHRRLGQIGLVDKAQGVRLSERLATGQRLVSREGDLWRWDGLRVSANAPSATARRLAAQNRLTELKQALDAARNTRQEQRVKIDAAIAATKSASEREQTAREALRRARRDYEIASEALQRAEQLGANKRAREAALQEALKLFAVEEEKTNAGLMEAQARLKNIPPDADLKEKHTGLQMQLAEKRLIAAEARAKAQMLEREKNAREQRQAFLKAEVAAWQNRYKEAALQQEDYQNRKSAVEAEIEALQGKPAEIMLQRRSLLSEIDAAKLWQQQAADARVVGERTLFEAEKAARAALAALSEARESQIRGEARLEAAKLKFDEAQQALQALAPSEEPAPLAYTPAAHEPLLSIAEIESRLAELKRDRDRLGPVNLRAEQELNEVEEGRARLIKERDELEEAIAKLRRGIASLNKEGRERLNAAFSIVNGHFKSLFTRLFGGGTAELKLIEADDPLEAGLDILAHPPGKKPQVITLLSGGEQALTATALIFAVFLTNPSPICVLDEVDAPLDDANVERLCDLLVAMAGETQTRFITITHNPITMARMSRLYGVTMVEQGVSQLVSVNLAQAASLVEAA